MRRLALLPSFVILCSCQTSYLVAKGDAALERGENELALADYQAALGRRVVESHRQEVEAKRNRAALLFAREEIVEGRRLTAEGKTKEARERLARLLAADAFRAKKVREEIVEALALLDRDQWREAERSAEQGRFVPAVRLAERLAASYPKQHPAHERVARLRRRARRHHIRAAEVGEGAARWFHLRMAGAFGATALPGLSELERALDAKARYRVEATLDEQDCPRFGRVLRERMLRSRATGSSTLALTIERCVEAESLWTEKTPKTYADRLPKPGFEERPYWVDDTACDERAKCLRYDRIGVCLEREKRCRATERRLAVKQVPVIQYEEVQQEIDVEVRHRRVEVLVAGTVAFDGRAPVPFRIERTVDDEEYWFPGGQKLFGPTDLSRVATSAFDDLARKADQLVAKVQAEEAVVAAERAEQEAEYVAAVRLGRTVPEPAAAHFQERYGLTEQDALRVMFGGALFGEVEAPEPVRLVQPERDPELDDLEFSAVAQTQPAGGLEALAQGGVDLSATVGTSPLASASRIHGLTARFRFTRLHLAVSGQSALLGGDVGGFGVSMIGVSLDLDENGFFFGFGLNYEQQRTDAGERYANFSIPLLLRVPIASWLWLGARFDPNLLYAKTIFDEEESDPHFYSPISLWGVVDFEHAFIRVGVAHYVGAGFGGEVAQVEGALGVRL